MKIIYIIALIPALIICYMSVLDLINIYLFEESKQLCKITKRLRISFGYDAISAFTLILIFLHIIYSLIFEDNTILLSNVVECLLNLSETSLLFVLFKLIDKQSVFIKFLYLIAAFTFVMATKTYFYKIIEVLF
nr:MAG TPA: hypothetical protein [Caudoviricetes sp.]